VLLCLFFSHFDGSAACQLDVSFRCHSSTLRLTQSFLASFAKTEWDRLTDQPTPPPFSCMLVCWQ
jgi:hypothetical protein